VNRAERRRQKLNKTDPSYNIKASNLNKMKQNATEKGINDAFLLMLAIPVMVIHDKYSLIMKRNVDGKSREERFTDLCLDLYDSFNQGYVTLDELQQCLEEETGIKIVKG